MDDTTAPLLHRLSAIISTPAQPAPPAAAAEGSPWSALVDLALAHGVGPLLLQQAHGMDEVERQRLHKARSRVTVHHMLATKSQAELQRAFDRAGIPCIWIKGIALAETVYAAPELRPMVDIDVLVPYEQREAALEVAAAAGYHPPQPFLFDGTEGLKHHYHLRGSTANAVCLELHFRLLGAADKLLTVRQLEWFWTQRHAYAVGDIRCQTLRPEAHFLYLAAHALLQHGEADFYLLRFFDLHQLVTRHADFDWELLIGQAVALRWTFAVERCLQLCTDYFDTPVPAGVSEELSKRRPLEEEIAHVQRRQRRRSLSQVVLHDLDTMNWRDRLRTAGQILIPSAQYMRWRYDVEGGAWPLALAYLRRFQTIGKDVVQSVRHRIESKA